ncbi:MAG: FkbM family methyltransferase [Candidatus Poribacteria bacterium]|nr:FkbM family methyltransferase [Candidatus Poribacteria bacterium]
MKYKGPIHVVQAGLDKSNEYAFLVEGVNPETGRGKGAHPLPFNWQKFGLGRDDDRVFYHGIEPHPESYQRLVERFGDRKNQKYYNIAVSHTNDDIEIDDFRRRHYRLHKDKGAKIKVISRTIEGFFQDAGIDHCHLLVLHIEGWEYEALKAYQGKVPIDFMIVALHPKENPVTRKSYEHSCTVEVFESLCEEKGFKITARFASNGGNTLDYHLERAEDK